MNEEVKKQAIKLFLDLTNEYRKRSKSDKINARIIFHINLGKIDGLQPHDTQFIHSTQAEFCREYSRFRNIFSKPKVRRQTLEKVKEHFGQRTITATFRPEKKNPSLKQSDNKLIRNQTKSQSIEQRIT